MCSLGKVEQGWAFAYQWWTICYAPLNMVARYTAARQIGLVKKGSFSSLPSDRALMPLTSAITRFPFP